jgi:DNA-binding ferritin-like protein
LSASAYRLLCLLALVGCAPTGPVRAALYQDLPTLRREIQSAERAGKLDRSAVLRVADAVAEREVTSAEGDSGVRHVHALRACVSPVLPALRKRAERHDDVGAEAMLARLVVRDIESSRMFESHAQDADPAWRAVAARAAIDASDELTRRAWFTDPDQRVRRAALEAATQAPLPGDLSAALEAFRLDPDPMSRSLAARVAGAIGGELSVLGLRDRFARADEEGRLTIIEAWAAPASYSAGGARELRVVADAQQGLLSVAAAQALLRMGDKDGSLAGLLAEAIDHGVEDQQRLALLVAPLSDARVAAAVERATHDANPEVSVIALSRSLDMPNRAADARKALRALVEKHSSAAAEARAALAFIGDRSVVPELVAEAQSGPPERRGAAAVALFRLGESARAAATLADSDPGVRIATACGILSARPRDAAPRP